MVRPTLQRIATNGIHLRVAVAGEGPLIILVHGFPELWYSWRHQIAPLVEAGFRVAVPDVRGYGGSDKPFPIEAYDMASLMGDMLGLIDALGARQASLVGHDWGAPIVWTTAALHPDRIAAVAALSVPYGPRPPVSPLTLYREVFKDRFFYQLYFQEPGLAEAEWEADVRGGLRRFYYAISGDAPDKYYPRAMSAKTSRSRLLDNLLDPDPFPAWLTVADLDYYVDAFTRSGFRGPLNRYRNHDRDWAARPELATLTLAQPALFVAGTKEPVLTMIKNADPIARMRPFVPNLRDVVLIEGGGHWIQQERPEAVNKALVSFFASLRSELA